MASGLRTTLPPVEVLGMLWMGTLSRWLLLAGGEAGADVGGGEVLTAAMIWSTASKALSSAVLVRPDRVWRGRETAADSGEEQEEGSGGGAPVPDSSNRASSTVSTMQTPETKEEKRE
jgi:hypothetical protein